MPAATLLNAVPNFFLQQAMLKCASSSRGGHERSFSERAWYGSKNGLGSPARFLAASRSQCLLKREFRHAQVITGAEVWALKTFFPRSSIHHNLPILNSDSSRFKQHTENATFVEPVLFEMEHIRE
jgi:hypothetical protein